jgi:L-rhamnose mutarotase
MTRQCLLLDLKDDSDLIAAYRAWHAPGQVPRSVIAHIRQQGILAMEIWNVGDRLVMIVETDDDDKSALASAGTNTDDIDAWERLMDRFQRRLALCS